MELFTLFTFPTLSYKCSLNPRGRRRYGSLEQLIALGNGIPSTVGHPDGSRQARPDFRSSIKHTSFIEVDLDPVIVNNNLQSLVQEDARSIWSNKQKYDILEYTVGGFFKEHRDKQLHKQHYGTLLIFPPAVGDFAHTGGELLLDGGKFTFESSRNREWIFLAFQTNIPHECKEVISGKRIVFKTELYSTKNTPEYDFPPTIVDGGFHRFDFPDFPTAPLPTD